jgi:hypothetical protein
LSSEVLSESILTKQHKHNVLGSQEGDEALLHEPAACVRHFEALDRILRVGSTAPHDGLFGGDAVVVRGNTTTTTPLDLLHGGHLRRRCGLLLAIRQCHRRPIIIIIIIVFVVFVMFVRRRHHPGTEEGK